MYTVHCTYYYTAYVHIVHCKLASTMVSLQCTVNCQVLFTVQFSLSFSVYGAFLYGQLQCTVCRVQCTLSSTVISILYTVQYSAQYTVHYIEPIIKHQPTQRSLVMLSLQRATVPVLTSGKEEKRFSVLVHSFMLSDRANSVFTPEVIF